MTSAVAVVPRSGRGGESPYRAGSPSLSDLLVGRAPEAPAAPSSWEKQPSCAEEVCPDSQPCSQLGNLLEVELHLPRRPCPEAGGACAVPSFSQQHCAGTQGRLSLLQRCGGEPGSQTSVVPCSQPSAVELSVVECSQISISEVTSTGQAAGRSANTLRPSLYPLPRGAEGSQGPHNRHFSDASAEACPDAVPDSQESLSLDIYGIGICSNHTAWPSATGGRCSHQHQEEQQQHHPCGMGHISGHPHQLAGAEVEPQGKASPLQRRSRQPTARPPAELPSIPEFEETHPKAGTALANLGPTAAAQNGPQHISAGPALGPGAKSRGRPATARKSKLKATDSEAHRPEKAPRATKREQHSNRQPKEHKPPDLLEPKAGPSKPNAPVRQSPPQSPVLLEQCNLPLQAASGNTRKRVSFARGPLADVYHTADGHPDREGRIAVSKRGVQIPPPDNFNLPNIRMLEQMLGDTCQPSISRLKRRLKATGGGSPNAKRKKHK